MKVVMASFVGSKRFQVDYEIDYFNFKGFQIFPRIPNECHSKKFTNKQRLMCQFGQKTRKVEGLQNKLDEVPKEDKMTKNVHNTKFTSNF